MFFFHILRRVSSVLTLVVILCAALVPTLSVQARAASFVGSKQYYLALGDSLAFGYQPDLNYDDGYVNDFSRDLAQHSTKATANLSCPGESTITMLHGKCAYALLRKYPYVGAQQNAALAYLAAHRGQVSPVTLDIGANDVLSDITFTNNVCSIDTVRFANDLSVFDTNLKLILQQLQSALTVNGVLTGDLELMNYYDVYQNSCPLTLPYIETLNHHLATIGSQYGAHIVDVYSAFGGPAVPNKNLCSYTWICSIFRNIHATDRGYSVIASAFEATVGY